MKVLVLGAILIEGGGPDAMEIHGAYGLSEEYPIANLYRTAIGAQAIMGSLDIQRVIIAKSLLGKGRYR